MKSDWKIKRLSDIAMINPRESIKKGEIRKKIPMDMLRPHCRDIPGYIMESFSGGAKFRNGDIIMARITPCLENGKIAKVNLLDDNEVGFGSTEYIIFRAMEGESDGDFLYYLINSPLVKEPAIKSMVGSSGRQRVQIDVVQNLEIALPTIDEQRTIGGLLRSIDDEIAVNDSINQNLELQMDSLYTEMFVTKADASWEAGTIADLGDVVGGGTPSKKVDAYYTEHCIAWVTPKDLSLDHSKFFSHGGIDITSLGLSKSSATLLPTGTVLFTSRAPIGYISIASNELCTNQGFKSVVPHENIGTAYVYCFLKANLSVIENMASGSTFKEVSGNTMKSVPVMLPDDETLACFNSFAMPLLQQQRNLESENHRLSTLRDTLLPRLMSGELDVSAINI